MHSSRRDAFKSINASPIAKVWPDKIEFLSEYKSKQKNKPIVDITFTDKVALLKYYPGQESDILDYYALKHKGIVIEGTGFGHLPTSETINNWLPKLKKHIRNGFVVCITTQCISGRTNPLIYSNGRELEECGVIFLEDMHSETALMKLSFILGHYGSKILAKDKMLENLAGEFNERLQIDM